LAAKGRKIAILVNEIGEIGLDDQFLRRLGFNVYEMLGGCICCTLAGQLPDTIRQLHNDYASDLVLMEPSGAADPAGVLTAVDDLPADIVSQVRRITILDPLRLEGLWAVLQPLIQSSIKNCDIALINKADAATGQEIEFAKNLVAEQNPAAKAFTASALNGLDEQLLEELLS
jgi:G3E family GTPase